MRSFVGFCLFILCRLFWKKPPFLSLYFHNPTPHAFEAIIRWVKKQGYDFVDIPGLLDYMKQGKTDGRKHCIITFDDAWKNNLKLIPIIEKYNAPITIFAPVKPLVEGNYWWRYVQKVGGMALSTEVKSYPEEKFNSFIKNLKDTVLIDREAMTLQDLKMISKHPLVNIQCHSYTHPILTNISDSSLDYELRESKRYLENELEKDITVFCYPNGSFSEREEKKVAELYECAFSTIQDNPRVEGDVFSIPRYALTDNYWSNLAKIIGAWKLIVK